MTDHVHGDWDAGGYCNKLVLRDGAGDVCGHKRTELEELLPYEPIYSPKENFNYHVVEFVLSSGEQGGIRVETECKGANKDDCACTDKECQLKDLMSSCGWQDVMKSAGDIPLGKVSARMDWTDYEEPWVEVEP